MSLLKAYALGISGGVAEFRAIQPWVRIMHRSRITRVAGPAGIVAVAVLVVALIWVGTRNATRILRAGAAQAATDAAYALAGGMTLLLLCLVATLLLALRTARRREAQHSLERSMLADANRALALAKTRADDKAVQLEATLTGMTDGVAMVDGNLRLLEWNPRFPEIAGVPAGILHLGMPMEEILQAQATAGEFGAVDIEAEVARRLAILRSGAFPGVVERQRPDGRVIELRRNALPDGGFVTLYTDITARKHAEYALRDAHAIAEAARGSMARFVAIVSHEIRTPLNALLNTLALLAGSAMATPQQTLVDTARRSGDALHALINDILEMSRMEAGQLALRPSVFALRPLLDSALEMFAGQAAERRIVLRLAVARDLPEELYEDPGRVRQVLINLLSNAVKFAAAGEVRVTAALRYDGDAATLRLAVRDRGPVIPEEGRALLFQPFSRLGEAGEEVPLGTGLGLTICRHLVALMGGEIGCSAWSMGGRDAGNEFWIMLPLKERPSDSGAAHEQPSARPSLPRTRILLVEDIVANQLVTAALLRREGHMVDVAGTGGEALLAVTSRLYDLVLMDIFMPGLSGLDTTRRIRAMSGVAATVPILALTANVLAEDQALCAAAGMNGILGKPVVLPDLLGAIARHVWPHRPSRPLPEPARPSAAGTVPPILAADRLASLRTNLSPVTLAGLVEQCLSEFSERLHGLKRLLEAGAETEVIAEAHAMAGMAAEYGMLTLEARLRTLMVSGHTRSQPPDDIVGGLAAELARVAPALRAALQGEPV